MWNMRTKVAFLILSAVAFGASATLAVARQQQPKPFLWEKEANKFFGRTIPKIENPIDKRINQRLKSISLPEPPALSETLIPKLDQNRDGVVSRQEYMPNVNVPQRGTDRGRPPRCVASNG
jgi:hypothetical protein